MAEFTYETRRKLTDKLVTSMAKKGKQLSKREKKMLPDIYGYTVPMDVCGEMRQLLQSGTYWTLSDLYRNQFQDLVDVCVRESQQTDFYYALDEMNCYQMTAGWFRRSLRSVRYEPFVEQSIRLLRTYAKLDFYGGDLVDILTGNVAPKIMDHARNEYFDYSEILAAQIDRGDERTIQAVKDILYGENNTIMMSHELILGIVKSKSRELYEDLGKFLLAARLQEGARQAVCEAMDAGRPEAFLHLFSVIEENDLIRYSSVKRAVSTWIGIFNENSVERVSEKLLRMMGQCLRDEAFAEEQLAANDAVAISCALWAKGFYDAEDAVKRVLMLIQSGTKQQKMTASYFNLSLQNKKMQMKAAKEVLLAYPEDMELAACFMPGFMASVNSYFTDLLRDGNSTFIGFNVRDEKVRRPKPMAAEELFQNREEAAKIYAVLKGMMERIPKKGLKLSPCIFPWHEVSVSQSDIAVRMCLIAWMLQEDAILDEAAEMIPLIGQGQSYNTLRSEAARVLLYRPKTVTRKKVLFELLHNGEEFTNQAAYKLAEDMELSAEDYIEIEQNLKYKKGRTQTLALLRKQDNAHLAACIRRLLAEKSEECHMGALDLALQLKKDDKKIFESILPQLQAFANPTGKEQVLLKELLGAKSEAEDILNTPGFGLYDVKKEWVLPELHVDESEAEKIFVHGEKAYIHVLQELDRLIVENRERFYATAWGEELLLGSKLEQCRWRSHDKEEQPLDLYPFRELWEAFYEAEINTPQFMLEIELYCQCCQGRADYEQNSGIYQEVFQCTFSDLGTAFSCWEQLRTVVTVLFDQYVPHSFRAHVGICAITKLLSTKYGAKIDTSKLDTRYAAGLPVFAEMREWSSGAAGQEWENSFAQRFRQQLSLGPKGNFDPSRHTKPNYNNWVSYTRLSDYVQCYVRGIWDKDLFYKAVFSFCGLGNLLGPVSLMEQKEMVSSWRAEWVLNTFLGEDAIQPVEGKYRFDVAEEETPEMAFAHELYREIIPVVLKVELKRGEQPTPFSEDMENIHVIYGIDYMIQILTALGKDPLQRGHGYYAASAKRKTVLSHLLKVSRPGPEETAEDLKKALKGTDITKKRLVELAMYAQQWIPLMEEYLKLPGFASTCYYFMAHTSEDFDEQVSSMIAKYTPLSPEELRDGAFDIHWFFEAYEKLGEKNFKLLYDAAKYSATGTAHGRARKYADAALGNVDKEALMAEIEAKRNKDLLMSIGLLPLPATKKEKEAELLDRYQFIQKYKKESRQFGAQRRASEGRAAEIALRNLSVNAGFTDVTRLMLRMEGKLTEETGEYFDWQRIDGAEEVELMVSVDENGKASLQCRKDGKLLKSVPAKHKKEEKVLKFQQTAKALKEQYSRTKQMMEQAMEDRTSFEVWELLELQKNPITKPIIEPLLVKADGEAEVLGFLTENGIEDFSGKVCRAMPEDTVFIAHPFDLYQSGHWHEYQKLLFEKQRKQPFKQVFRELYVKLEEELDKEESRLFSGNQIQPQKTVGALRSRRWVADYEDGLQKIYYKENIVAYIYAMADWFSPSDVEAPTLEYVVFSERKTGKLMKIKDVPDIIYSEVMRDVDLAVSVAHAGGVDPETSHSTIEMRRAIVECNLNLFQTKNVRLEGNHAIIDGKLGQYTVHLGSGVVHQAGNAMLFVIPVHSQHRGRIFLPFVDDDPKTAEIMSKILLFAEDTKIKDPNILRQIQQC